MNKTNLDTARIIARIYRLQNEFLKKATPELEALETVAKNLSREWVSATEFVITDDEDKRRQQSQDLGRIHTLHADSEDRLRLFSGTIERRFVKDQKSRNIPQYRFVPVSEKMPEFKEVIASAILIEEELEKVTKERNEAYARVTQLNQELEQAIAERTPHDYGMLAEQRDQYKEMYLGAIKEIAKARAEVERLKDHIPDATKMIRPEPSRLEIAAMLQAGWLANPESEIDSQHEWWLAQADALIEAAKGGAK